ncbi:MAG: 5-oxoprolinase subunit PxpB [Chloroflexota bacterium]
MSLRAFGDRAFLLELEQRIDPGIAARARAIADAWEARGLGAAVPAYASVVLHFDPPTERAAALAAAEGLAAHPPESRPATAGRLIEIPISYDGPDLAIAASRSGLTPPDLVDAHAGREYEAFFLGFMPGLAYLGTLDPKIDVPRLDTPRPRVPAGSVGIANGQTLVYPFESPGGWHLIGRTALVMFDPRRDPAALIGAGDRVRFVPR